MRQLTLKTLALCFSLCMMLYTMPYALMISEAETTSATPNTAYDTAILNAVHLALGRNDAITIKVSNGIVSVVGQVKSDEEYERIIMIIESTLGVVSVDARALTIKEPHHSLADLLLSAKIKGVILQAGLLGQNIATWPIVIAVKNGDVFLSGQAVSSEQKETLLNLIKEIEGVNKINDNIGILTQPKSL